MKRFYCKSPVLIFICGLAALLIAGGIYCIVAPFTGEASEDPYLKWGGFVGALIVIPLMGVTIAYFVRKRILFTDDTVSVRNDFKWRGFFSRIQHATEVKFLEIISLSYKKSKRDSKGKEMFWVFVDMPYIVFHCEDGKEKAINLYYFTRRQRIKIIDEVIARVKKEGRELNVSSAKELIQSYKAK